MADKSTIDNLAQKFQEWAQSLPDHEQATLAEWMERIRAGDVRAYRADTWWQEPGGWARWWSDSWEWS